MWYMVYGIGACTSNQEVSLALVIVCRCLQLVSNGPKSIEMNAFAANAKVWRDSTVNHVRD